MGESSGGSAVAVAVCAATFSLGTDTDGSMTIPAACCSIVGYRPTRSRYPTMGSCRFLGRGTVSA
ncbi:amidase family protein [Streptomyces sp. NBC_01622]|uniref:amidase family protein n=1 Tax=Streptomyces sp. NBC_01622 TaxID=2975903 RepID=UPI00386456DC